MASWPYVMSLSEAERPSDAIKEYRRIEIFVLARPFTILSDAVDRKYANPRFSAPRSLVLLYSNATQIYYSQGENLQGLIAAVKMNLAALILYREFANDEFVRAKADACNRLVTKIVDKLLYRFIVGDN